LKKIYTERRKNDKVNDFDDNVEIGWWCRTCNLVAGSTAGREVAA